MTAILFSTFLNTGLLMIIVNADLKFAPWPFKLIPLDENYVDYD